MRAEWERGGVGRGRSKKSKPIPDLSRGAELNSCPISAPITSTRQGKPARDKAGEGRVKRGEAKLTSLKRNSYSSF